MRREEVGIDAAKPAPRVEPDASGIEPSFSQVLFILVFVCALAGCVMTGIAVWRVFADPRWETIMLQNFAVALGIPAAGVGALLIVALFRTTEGQIRFELWGLKFEGASGPIVMWVIAFLAIVLGIRALLSAAAI